MKVLGFRSDPNTPRYAIVDAGPTPITLVNEVTESRLCFPADYDSDSKKCPGSTKSLKRVFHLHPKIANVVIKIGEFTMGDNKAKRSASYQEAAFDSLLWSQGHSHPYKALCVSWHAEQSGQGARYCSRRANQWLLGWQDGRRGYCGLVGSEQSMTGALAHDPNRSERSAAQ